MRIRDLYAYVVSTHSRVAYDSQLDKVANNTQGDIFKVTLITGLKKRVYLSQHGK